MQIKDLSPESKRVNILIKLIARDEPRYAKGYKITTYTAADATGTIAIPFWNADGDTIEVGDYIQVENGYVSTFRDNLQLNVGRFGSFRKVEPPDEFEITDKSQTNVSHPSEAISIELVAQQTKNLTVEIHIQEKLDEQIVLTKSDGKEHRVATYLVGDETGCIFLKLWDQWIDLVQVGETYRLYNGYVGVFRAQRVLNLSRWGKIEPFQRGIQINIRNNLSEGTA